MLTYEVGSTLASYIISLKNKHYLYILVDASLDWCATHCTPLGRAEFLQYTLSLLAIISIADRSEIDMFSIEQEIRPRIR
jgi:hypothetical protein